MTETLALATTRRPAWTGADGMFRAGVLLTLALLLAAFVSVIWTPHPLDRVDVAARLAEPGAAHPFGTDAAGRDVLSLTMKGALTSYVVAAVGTAIAFFGGTALGLAAAAGGRASRPIAGGMGAFLAAAPALAIAAMISARFGPGAVNAMLAIGCMGLPLFLKLTHDAVEEMRSDDTIAAARLTGMSRGEAWRLHAMPRFLRRLMARVAGFVALAVPTEAALSYVGFGAQPGGMSLGLMLRDAQSYLTFAPHLAVAPGAILALVALGLLLIGDGLRRATRDLLDAAA